MLNIKTSSKSLLDKYMDQFTPEKETCPICSSRGCCHVHAYYDRSIIDYSSGRKVKYSVCIMRVMCDSCNHTHAILPDHIIPYGTHGLFFVLRVLAEHFLCFRKISSICEKYDISENLFHKWKLLFLEHKKLWLGMLSDKTSSTVDFLKSLLFKPFSQFSKEFISRFSFSFLQAHKNPSVFYRNTAGYCQKVFSPDYVPA